MPLPVWIQPTIETSIAYYAEVLGAEGSHDEWLERQRVLCQGDLFYLMVHALNRPDVAHPWLFDRCREVQKEPNGCLDLWAREHGKSSIITFGLTIQDILNDPEDTICIFSHTKGNAKKFLRQIKNEFEMNKKLQEIFPDILYSQPDRESSLWSEDAGLVVKRKGNPKEPTLKCSGLVDGQPTGDHFGKRVYDDAVTMESVTTPDQIAKTNEGWEMSISLGTQKGVERYIGTRYCTIGSTRILMADWTHKPISEVVAGDIIVGWATGKSNKRYLVKSRVIKTGSHVKQEVNKYTFDNGRHVTCTADHLWWRGPYWAAAGKEKPAWMRGKEYSALGFGYHDLKHIRQLLIPREKNLSWDSGWLSGFFDGEGCLRKNTHHASGSVQFTQTVKNMQVIEQFRKSMKAMGFRHTEDFYIVNKPNHHNGYHFSIIGGWDERYRFLAEVCPSRKEKISDSLFAQMHTDRLKLISIEDSGLQDVYWLETETGNYVAEGFCSKNSMHDTYYEMLKRDAVKPRLYPATHNGKMDGRAVLFTQAHWEELKKKKSRFNIASQYLQNPLADEDAVFSSMWLHAWEVRPRTVNIAILGDPNRKVGAGNDNCSFSVVALSATGNKFLVDGYCHQMTQSQRWTALRDLYKKWSAAPGVMNIQVGYEKYGAEQDLNYFQERQQEEKCIFAIEELSWTREGTKGEQGKRARIERLEPDFRNSRFYLPQSVYHNGKPGRWRVDNDADSKAYQTVVYSDVEGLTKAQMRAIESGDQDLICKAIKRVNEEGKVYDVTEHLITEFLYFPFGEYKDALDSLSRFYDLDMIPPVAYKKGAGEPPQYWDS